MNLSDSPSRTQERTFSIPQSYHCGKMTRICRANNKIFEVDYNFDGDSDPSPSL